MCRDGIPPKNCAAVIILALSSSGAKRKYFLTSSQGLLRNVTLQFHSRGWITIPGFPSKKKWNSTGWPCPTPALPLYRGRDLQMFRHLHMMHTGYMPLDPNTTYFAIFAIFAIFALIFASRMIPQLTFAPSSAVSGAGSHRFIGVIHFQHQRLGFVMICGYLWQSWQMWQIYANMITYDVILWFFASDRDDWSWDFCTCLCWSCWSWAPWVRLPPLSWRLSRFKWRFWLSSCTVPSIGRFPNFPRLRLLAFRIWSCVFGLQRSKTDFSIRLAIKNQDQRDSCHICETCLSEVCLFWC